MKYIGICKEKGVTIRDDEALTYAILRILDNKQEQEDFLEWYYSGNWVKED